MTRNSVHSVPTLTAESATVDAIRRAIRVRMAQERIAADTLVARKPTAANGHSDGVRVRYVRADVTAAILADVLALLDDVR